MQADLKRIKGQDGLTLLELIVTMSILALAISLAASIWLVGRVVSRDADKWGDRNEQLRMAMNMIGEDLTYAVPDGDPSPARFNWCCSPEIDLAPHEREGFRVAIYQPRVNASGLAGWDAGWTSAGWLGWIGEARSLRVRYSITHDGSLIREVASTGDPRQIYVQQVVMTNLSEDSTFTVDSAAKLVQVTLKTQETGGNPGAEATGAWYIRNINQN